MVFLAFRRGGEEGVKFWPKWLYVIYEQPLSKPTKNYNNYSLTLLEKIVANIFYHNRNKILKDIFINSDKNIDLKQVWANHIKSSKRRIFFVS